MRIKTGLALAFALFLVVPAFGTSVSTGEVLDITGFNNTTSTLFWTGSFTIGASLGSSLWGVSAFSVNPPGCAACTSTFPAWTLTSFEFDSATSDLAGGASADFNGTGTGVHFLTLTFVDGNNSSDAWSDFNAKKGTTKTGTFSYTVTVETSGVPEPSAGLLLACGLTFLVARSLGSRLFLNRL